MPRHHKHEANRWHDLSKDRTTWNTQRHTSEGFRIQPNRCFCGKAMKSRK